MKNYKQLYDEAKKAKSMRSLTPEYHQWGERGDAIIGSYVSQNSVEGQLEGKSYNQYIFDADKGRVKFALGRAADSEYAGMFKVGVVYAVTFQGKEKISHGRSVNRFTVEEVGIADQVDDVDLSADTDDSKKHQK